jgi:hypothetical protein
MCPMIDRMAIDRIGVNPDAKLANYAEAHWGMNYPASAGFAS